MEERYDILKYSGIYLLLVLFFLFTVSSILFFFHISLTIFHFIISILLSSTSFLFLNKKKILDRKVGIQSIIVSFLVLLLSISFMTFIYDRSSDGNTYHKDAIGNLYQGWNPVYQSSTEFLENKQIENYNINHYDIWKDHYAKANWILEASIYKVTNRIESGKAISLILMYILFTLSFSYFYDKLGKKSILFSFLITFNPITCNQLFTFYNDQLGASLLFLLIISLLKIVDRKDKDCLMVKFGILFSIFTLITNIKFNIMGYGVIFTFVFMLWYLYQKYLEGKFLSSFKRLVPSYILLFVLSFLICGYPTYVKNFMDHGNFFYPVYGTDSEDIITAQQPEDFIEKGNLEKFLIGTFASTNNLQTSRSYQLKIPFTVSKEEIKESMAIDTRLSGFGILSSGLFLLSILGIVIYFIKSRDKNEKIAISLLLGVTIFLIFVISESWWARYNPQNYLFILIFLYLLLKYRKEKILWSFVSFVILINSMIILFGNTYYSLKNSMALEKEFSSLNKKKIVVSFPNGNMTGILYNLNDFDISYRIILDTDLENLTYYKYLNYEEDAR